MSLPQLNTPRYRLNIPSTDEEIEYRPFLVKEEKVLLIAQETGDEKAIYSAIKTLIKNCVYQDIKEDKLPLFDIEYLFLQIRAKSVGEVATLQVTCPDDEETKVTVEVDLSQVVVQMEEEHDARIQLTEDIGVLMMYPQLDTVSKLSKSKGGEVDTMFDMIIECMYQIWEGEEVHDCMDYSQKDKKAFIESLTHEQFLKIQTFFETMPQLKHDVEIKNPKTGVESKVSLTGLNSFF
jgi:hypothetical protein